MRRTLLRPLMLVVVLLPGCTPTPPESAPAPGADQPAAGLASSDSTQVVFLGTGTPLPDPDRAGPATAVVVNGSAYLFDAGTGVVRRAAEAARRGIGALTSVNLKTVFITHLHSDHTLGLPDLLLTPWVMGRQEPLEVYGPTGLQAMVAGIQQAWSQDIDYRLHDKQPSPPMGYQARVHEIEGGEVYKDDNVTITAIPVSHGPWIAFGYKIRTPDRTIVLSGDTRPSTALAEACQECDILIYEIYTVGSTAKVTPAWQEYRRVYHTSTRELADLAAISRPKRLVLYHRANPGCDQVGTACGSSGSEEEALSEMHEFYNGAVVEAHDLDVF